jgi:hypothetical protein
MNGTTSVGLRSLMGLCTRFHSTGRQSIKLLALMAAIIICPSSSIDRNRRVSSKLVVQRCNCGVVGVLAWFLAPAMPRLRGKPRRGAGWYAADSRRKRHRNFQRAVSVVRQRRRRANIAAGSPPITLVEEDPDLELPSDFSESKMFTVPDNWDPPTCFVAAEALPRFTGAPGPCATQSGEHDTCVVEEEPPNSPIELKTDTQVLGQRETKNEPQTPPSPPLLHPEHLQLIFEIRNLVDDQLFRAVRVSQRLDMLYTAYSRTTPRQQCPTCSQPFAIPASSGEAKNAHAYSGD